MTIITSILTPHTGDENPGGPIRQEGGMGWVAFVSDDSLKTRSTGETRRISGKRKTREAGGPRLQFRRNRCVVASIFQEVAFEEVVFRNSRSVPGGTGR